MMEGPTSTARAGRAPEGAREEGGLADYLGPARVVRLGAPTLLVTLEDAGVAPAARVHATPALAFPYVPAVGDEVLVVGDASAFWIIGVIAGRGRADLDDPRGVAIRAEGGALRLVGDRGVRLTGSSLHLEAERLRTLAVIAVTTFGERVTRVRERLATEVGQLDEVSAGRALLQAGRVVIKTLKSARIKSTAVRVG